MTSLVSTIWFALVIWLISRAYRQRNALQKLPCATQLAADAPRVAVIIPARDERDNIGSCLQSLLRQDYPIEKIFLIVVDDESTDDTAVIVKSMMPAAPHIELLHAPPLPPTWKGKVNACWNGACAVPRHVEWLCFLDADMRAEPALISSAVQTATKEKLDLLSLAPRHELISFAERLMIPCGLYLLSFSQNLSHAHAPHSDTVVATGQFMLVRRQTYFEAGGHAAVHTSICEDVDLARLLKRRGHRVLLLDGSQLLTTRMYTGWKTLWPGIAKNLTDMLGGPSATLITAFLAFSLVWTAVLLPPFDFLTCSQGTSISCYAGVLALLGSFAALALHVAGTIYFRIPFWYGALFPLGYTIGAFIALDSLRWRWTGRIRWKGRIYQ